MEAIKWILGYLKNHRVILVSAFAIVIVVNLLNMVNAPVQGRIVDDVIIGRKTGLLPVLLLIMGGATLLKTIFRYAYQYMFEFVSQRTIYRIRDDIYKKLQTLDFKFFDTNKTGDIMTRMTGDLEAVRHFCAWVVFAVFFNVLTFVTVMVILFSMNARFTLLMLTVTPFIAFFAYKLATTVKPAWQAIRAQFAKLNSIVQENISGNRVVKAFAKEEYEISKFSAENAAYRDRNIKASAIWSRYLPVLDAMAGLLFIVIILAGGSMVIHKTLTLGQLVTFNAYIFALSNPLRMAGWIINDIQRFAASAEKIKALLEVGPRITNDEDAVTAADIKGRVEFRDVSFSYGDEEVLRDVSFCAKPGQTVAVIGPTGSGKSTLVSLICRFYDCSGGELTIDGIDVKKLDIKSLRDNVAVAMQDIFLFSDTIEGNIAYGVPDASIEQVKWAASAAGADGFINNFPDGYDTIIGERGVGLSGGQKQRIALARALLKDPRILILDDTTSSVDIETEHEIQKMLGSVYEDKTTFIIAHRISSVRNADLILVLDDGRIKERGTHEELLAGKGYYYNVFINQYGDFDNIYAKEVQ